MPSIHLSKTLHCIVVTREKTVKQLNTARHRYKEHHNRRVHDTIAFRPGQWAFVDLPSLAVPAADLVATDSYPKLLSLNLGPYRILYSTIETVPIDEEDVDSPVSSDQALVALQPEIGVDTSSSRVMNLAENALGPSAEHAGAD